MLDRRLQILLDDQRYQRLAALARQRKMSVAAVIRDAIDAAVASPSLERAAAAERVLSAPRMPVPEPRELRRELDQIRDRRA